MFSLYETDKGILLQTTKATLLFATLSLIRGILIIYLLLFLHLSFSLAVFAYSTFGQIYLLNRFSLKVSFFPSLFFSV